jgi:hypothetical protein
MRALIVYESMFGSTEEIAEAVAKGLRAWVPTDVVEIAQAPTRVDDDVVLLVVGAPTHGHGMTRPATRAAAGRRASGSLVSNGGGAAEWLRHLPPSGGRVAATAFDARLDLPRWLAGSASARMARILQLHDYPVVAEPASFFVSSATGPVAEGEQSRAREWGAGLAAAVRDSVNHGQERARDG